MRSGRLRTRELLVCAALAAIQVLAFAILSPLMVTLGQSSPPLYALAAGVHSIMPFLARLLTAAPGTATLTGLFTGVLATAFTPIGPLVIVPMLTAGLAFDLVLPWRRTARTPLWRVALAAGAAGIGLFAVSLPVFSAEHLAAPVLTATLLGRLAGELAAAACALPLRAALGRRGVRAAPDGSDRGEAQG
jgi:hypothetical protein